MDSVAHLLHAVTEISKRDKMDVFMIDDARIQGEKISFRTMFEAIERIKNGHVVSTMYVRYVEVIEVEQSSARDRKVFWLEDLLGRADKSTFSKFLNFGQKDWKVKKLPIDKPDRIRMAVCKIVQKEDVYMFTFDFTRMMGENTSMKDIFQIIEEIKNGHIVSVMYGKIRWRLQ